MIRIERDSPAGDDVRQLLDRHLADMFATYPAESVHALDHAALMEPAITIWTAREGATLLASGALREISPTQGEIKSMCTAQPARGRGVAQLLLTYLIGEARKRNYEELLLETGTQDFFAPARRLYARNGFIDCPPFADYRTDPSSAFMRLKL
ncbi:GNAT family N-acetyltransferase [Arthrobacter sp. H5]|uniref:GNAT family N-acetyltransferase n=1 Tax=Arthrobacter sp. H5 TaxID=1267973 RepID=UPI000482230A|nr:GNAT family N-acetyltransferase [Arthrobacter sp. H5]